MSSLRPLASIAAPDLAAGKRALVADAAWASMTGALSGGVVLVAFAIELGADARTLGLLGAIPFIAQAAQLPALLLVERLRVRKALGIPILTVARLLILLLALLPVLPGTATSIVWLLLAQASIATMGSVSACAINSWFHQLLPPAELGMFFSRRLLWATGIASACTLGAGLLVEYPPGGHRMWAFSICFGVAGIAGLCSSWCLLACPEPLMERAGPPVRLRDQLKAPFVDPHFKGVLLMQGSWNLASNLVAPFLAVYLIRQLGFALSTVTALWVASQLANAATLLAWGRVSDRLSNKSILRVALPMYFACTLGLVFIPSTSSHTIQLGLLFLLHVVMGMAGGGIGLATGNLGMKLAPRNRSTAYLAAIGLVSSVTGGAAPLVGGALAQWFSERQLAIIVRWVGPSATRDVSVLTFAHWEFLFAMSAALGLYVLHAVSGIREGTDISERRVIQEMGLEALRTVNSLSTIGGVLSGIFAFGRLSERRQTARGQGKPI